MKKILSALLLVLCFSLFTKANSDVYHLDETSLEESFKNAEDITAQYLLMLNGNFFNDLDVNQVKGEDKQMVAGIISLAQFFLGIGWLVPVHRFILGTNGQLAKVWGLYCVTISGCGVLLIVDGILLLLDESKSKYINNSKFIMWAN